jgi:hypothetical protein
MTDHELTAKIKAIASDPTMRTTAIRKLGIRQPDTPAAVKAAELRNRIRSALAPGKRLNAGDPLPSTVCWELVRGAEDRLGFRLPLLLGHLWVEVGNGGFGPGYGLLGLEGGHMDDAQGLVLPDLYLSAVEDAAWERFLGTPWPQKLVPICDWGCQHMSAMDCSRASDGEMVDLIDGYRLRAHAKITAQQKSR